MQSGALNSGNVAKRSRSSVWYSCVLICQGRLEDNWTPWAEPWALCVLMLAARWYLPISQPLLLANITCSRLNVCVWRSERLCSEKRKLWWCVYPEISVWENKQARLFVCLGILREYIRLGGQVKGENYHFSLLGIFTVSLECEIQFSFLTFIALKALSGHALFIFFWVVLSNYKLLLNIFFWSGSRKSSIHTSSSWVSGFLFEVDRGLVKLKLLSVSNTPLPNQFRHLAVTALLPYAQTIVIFLCHI